MALRMQPAGSYLLPHWTARMSGTGTSVPRLHKTTNGQCRQNLAEVEGCQLAEQMAKSKRCTNFFPFRRLTRSIGPSVRPSRPPWNSLYSPFRFHAGCR